MKLVALLKKALEPYAVEHIVLCGLASVVVLIFFTTSQPHGLLLWVIGFGLIILALVTWVNSFPGAGCWIGLAAVIILTLSPRKPQLLP